LEELEKKEAGEVEENKEEDSKKMQIILGKELPKHEQVIQRSLKKAVRSLFSFSYSLLGV
jgi:hypothetical protein